MGKRYLAKIVAQSFFIMVPSGCNVSDSIEQCRLKEVATISAFPDSSYFSDLRHLQCDSSSIYMLDVNRRDVVCLSKDLTQMKTFGMGGRGPGELQAPFSFVVYNDTVAILDFMGNFLKRYSFDGYIDQMKFTFSPNDGRIGLCSKKLLMPVVSDTCIYAAVTDSESRMFGGVRRIGNSRKTEMMNSAHILAYKDYAVVVPCALPYVQIYDKNGKSEFTIDLSCVRFYSKNMASVLEKSKVDADSIYMLNIDAYICGDELYILCPRYINGDGYRSDRIVVVDLKERLVTSVLSLPETNYMSICADDNRFYVFNYNKCSLDILEKQCLNLYVY